MSSVGKYLRWLSLVLLIIYQLCFIIHGSIQIKNEEGEMGGIFICNSPNDGNDSDIEITQCSGLDDVSTCGDGQCIRSSCGRPFFPGIGISYSGSSDPFDSDAARSTKSIITTISIMYSLIPYCLILVFSIHFLAVGNVIPLTRLGMMGFVSLMNDVLLKHLVQHPRPTGSCLYFHSYGMPR